MLTDTRSSPAEYEHLSDTSLYTLEIGAARFAQLQKLRLFAAWSSFRRKSYPAPCKHCLTLQLHYLRWFTLYNKIYFWNIKSSCCDICGYQTTNFSITKTLPSQQNMIDDQLWLTREPIEQLISVKLFAPLCPTCNSLASDLVLSREERRSTVKSPKSPYRLFRLTISSLRKDETYYTIITLVLPYYRLKNEIYYIHY